MIFHKGWTTHIPMLLKMVQMTDGVVLEIGSGPFSTPLLHWLCAEARRELHTYESDPEYFKGAKTFVSKTHHIHFVKDWDKVRFKEADVALIDNEKERRVIEPVRLKDLVKYLVLHDTNRTDYGFTDEFFKQFKYVHHWDFCRPFTSVISNFNDAFKEKKISEVLTEYATDKNIQIKRGHSYGLAYDHLFKTFDRNAKLDIIEVGTEFGESLLAWREFFPNANITGIDIEDKVENKRKDINYIVKDVKEIKDPKKEYDIVIDDGSHKLSDVVYTVENFRLKIGGIMVIEDCQAPNHWFEEIRKHTKYVIELIDMRELNRQHDDYMIVLKNYGYY